MGNFSQNLPKAFANGFMTFINWIFVAPFKLYAKVVDRLADQQNSDYLNISKIDSPYPIFTYIDRMFTKFFFDFTTLLSYPIGALISVIAFGYTIYGHYQIDELFRPEFSTTLKAALGLMIGILIITYYMPIFFQFMRDFVQFSLMPFKKFLSWLKKPAQYMYIKKEEITNNK